AESLLSIGVSRIASHYCIKSVRFPHRPSKLICPPSAMGQKSKFRVTSARHPLATEADISSLMARTRQRQHDAKSPPGHAGRSEVWSGHEVRELISGAAYPRL